MYQTVNLPAVLYHSKDRLLNDVTESKVERTVLTEQRKQIFLHKERKMYCPVVGARIAQSG